MLPKYRNKEYIFDKLHRGFINVCVATTLVTGTIVAYQVYQYIRYVRPIHKAMQRKAQEELLAEGKHVQELM